MMNSNWLMLFIGCLTNPVVDDDHTIRSELTVTDNKVPSFKTVLTL